MSRTSTSRAITALSRAAIFLLLVLAPLAANSQSRQGSTDPAGESAESATLADDSDGTEQSGASPLDNVDEDRTELNLLGQVDISSGESRRNENVKINLVDNSVLKDLNIRVGATATAVEEFRADRRYFGSEFGGSPSESLHVAPSGGSGFHGSLYEAHSNSAFTARSFFQAGEVQPARENDYGFQLSVPLWKGANLGLQGSQRKSRGNVNGNVLVPRADERTPLATDPAMRDFVARILEGYPDEAPNRTDINERALNTNAPQGIDSDRGSIQLDQAWGDDTLVMRYRFTGQQIDAFQLVAGQNPNTMMKSHDARVTWIRAWSPATTTDFSVGFDRLGSLLTPDETNIGPNLFTRGLESLGPDTSVPIDRAWNKYRYAGGLRHVRGRHTIATGFEIVRRQINGFESSSHRGGFSFRSDFGRDAITNLRMGTASEFFGSVGEIHRGFRGWDVQTYVGDDWRATNDLTLNLGLRFTPIASPSEVNDLNKIPFDCDCNNLAPRFGFAYRLKDGWGVVRGAYGIHYGEIFPVTYAQARYNPPLSRRVAVPAPDLLNPLSGLGPDGLDPDARSDIFRISPDLVAPYAQQYNFTWEVPIRGAYTLQFGYVGSRSQKLLATWNSNRARPVPGIPQTTATTTERRPDPRYFIIREILNSSRGYYDAAKITFTTNGWRGLTVNSSYWFSKAIDLGADYTNTAAGRDSFAARGQSEFDVHADMKGLSNFDQPHAALWRVNYESPQLSVQPRWLRAALGSWQLSTIVLLKSGTPFNVRTGSDGPGFGNVDGSSSDRPNVVDPSVLGRTVGHPDTSTQLLPRSAFSFIEPTERRGSLGRNAFRKDGISNINAALSRRWPLKSDMAVNFSAESVNLFNTPQFAEPGREVASANFAAITNTLNDGRTFRFLLGLSF
jgi:hypothetical protein